uniref:Uncharacterized protein n=1 Tax=Arundo donax TaxID=35708 RepID=A0A0A9EM22_ARUDO
MALARSGFSRRSTNSSYLRTFSCRACVSAAAMAGPLGFPQNDSPVAEDYSLLVWAAAATYALALWKESGDRSPELASRGVAGACL